MTIKSTKNILFVVRQFATYKEEYDFAIRILAERVLLPYEGNGEKVDSDFGVSVILRDLKEGVKRLENSK